MKKIRRILTVIILLIVVVSLAGCNNDESKVGKIALVINSNLEKVKEVETEKKEDLQKPMDLQENEIAYVKNIYKNLAYVILLRPMEPQGVDSVGYIPIDNLKFDYTSEEMMENAIYCHIIKDNTPIYNALKGNQTGTIDSQYTMIEKRQENWALVSQKGGAQSAWINEENIDYDFSRFIEKIKNNEYDFEKKTQ